MQNNKEMITFWLATNMFVNFITSCYCFLYYGLLFLFYFSALCFHLCPSVTSSSSPIEAIYFSILPLFSSLLQLCFLLLLPKDCSFYFCIFIFQHSRSSDLFLSCHMECSAFFLFYFYFLHYLSSNLFLRKGQ